MTYVKKHDHNNLVELDKQMEIVNTARYVYIFIILINIMHENVPKCAYGPYS